jgi:hypothetical protein
MHALSIKQPWATLLVAGLTPYVVRDWRTAHRGPLAVHAGGTTPWENVALCGDPAMKALLRRSGCDFAFELPTRAVLGTVTLADCFHLTEGNRDRLDPEDPAVQFGLLRPGRWAWVCTDPHAFAHPVPMAGRLGVFDIPEALLPARTPA